MAGRGRYIDFAAPVTRFAEHSPQIITRWRTLLALGLFLFRYSYVLRFPLSAAVLFIYHEFWCTGDAGIVRSWQFLAPGFIVSSFLRFAGGCWLTVWRISWLKGVYLLVWGVCLRNWMF